MRARPILLLVMTVGLTVSLAIPTATAQTYGAAVWNGRRVAPGEHRAVAAVAPVEGICTGTLIHPRWILTAAHCLADAPASPVVVGLDGVDPDSGFGELFTSRLHVVHPRFNHRNAHFDFALVRLPAPSELAPVTLATATDEQLWAPGAPANIVGWGAIDGDDRGAGRRLRQGFTTVAPNRRCRVVHGIYDAESMVCGEADTADACRGDSGGPLFAVVDEQRIQIGVTSFGDACDRSLVGVYARVSAAQEWISETIASRRVPAFATDAGLITSADRIRLGRAVRVRAGLFRYSDGAPLVRQRVEILRRPRGTTRWRVAARRITNLAGVVRFRDEPRRDMQYALRHRSTRATQASRSPARTVRVVR